MDVHTLMQQNEARAKGVACDAKLHKAVVKHHEMGSRAAQWFLMPSYTAAKLHAAELCSLPAVHSRVTCARVSIVVRTMSGWSRIP